jgi:UPF0716 family protein affecting phage T7 exclusion
MFGVGAAMIGFCLAPMNWLERGLFLIGGLLLIDPGLTTDMAGFAMLAIGLLNQWRKRKTWAAAGSPTAAA